MMVSVWLGVGVLLVVCMMVSGGIGDGEEEGFEFLDGFIWGAGVFAEFGDAWSGGGDFDGDEWVGIGVVVSFAFSGGDGGDDVGGVVEDAVGPLFLGLFGGVDGDVGHDVVIGFDDGVW